MYCAPNIVEIDQQLLKLQYNKKVDIFLTTVYI